MGLCHPVVTCVLATLFVASINCLKYLSYVLVTPLVASAMGWLRFVGSLK